MTCFRMSNGVSVFSYCKNNKISYISVWFNLDKGMTPDKAVERAINRKGKRWADKLYYNGQPLIEYCRANGLNYQKTRRQLLKKDLLNDRTM